MGSGHLPGESFPSLFASFYYLEGFFRRRWYGSLAAEVISRLKSGRILDLGMGPGFLSLELLRRSPGLEVIGVDPSPGMVLLAKRLCGKERRVNFLVGGAYRLPFPPSSFDMVVSVGVLHHLLDLPRAFREVRRVLKPKGEAWFYEVVMDTGEGEVMGTLREMGILLFPTFPLFFLYKLLARVKVGRRLIGLREEDWANLERALEGTGLDWRMERKGPLLKVVLRKGMGW